jgi:hypothetical protein
MKRVSYEWLSDTEMVFICVSLLPPTPFYI